MTGKESDVTHNTTLSLWQQAPSETIEAIASVLMSHWRAAKAHPERLFWPGPASWLQDQARRLADLTTSQEAAGSSDTLPDPRPC